MSAITVPFSSYASPQAGDVFGRVLEASRKAPPRNGPIAASRAYFDQLNTSRAERMERLYPVTIEICSIGGVPTQIVTPKQGVASDQKHRVLINLHGGAFLWGAGSGGLVESIPVASLGHTRVITVDYRQGPEHVFPAASEDVAKVYGELLKEYPAPNIGIYGCSAGGVLTGEAVAWFLHRGMSLPGAVGTFCGSLVDFGGDSAHVAAMFDGGASTQPSLKLADLPYLEGARASDPLVFPANSPQWLAKFPPTLLLTGSRDYAMSSVIQSGRLLTGAGVAAELHVWDGAWHAFFVDPEMPESQEAYAVMVRFFDRRLGR